jgi:hypothetical protein
MPRFKKVYRFLSEILNKCEENTVNGSLEPSGINYQYIRRKPLTFPTASKCRRPPEIHSTTLTFSFLTFSRSVSYLTTLSVSIS